MLRHRTTAYAVVALALITGWLHNGVADADHMDRRDAEITHLRQELSNTQAWLTAYQSAYTELMDGLDRIERVNARGDRRAQFQVKRLISRTRTEAARYVDPEQETGDGAWGHDGRPGPADGNGGGYVGGVGQVVVRPQPGQPAQPQGPQPMKSGDYEALRRQISNAYTSEIPGLATEVARTSFVTVDQLIGLMKACSFDSARVDIAAAFYPRVVDRDGWFRVYDALEYSSNREALRARIGQGTAP